MSIQFTRSVFAFALLGAAGCQRSSAPAVAHAVDPQMAAAEAALPRMTVDQVLTRVQQHDGLVVYDNNSRERYQAGHVPSARWVAYRTVQASDLPADPAAPLVFYCGGEQCSACHTAALTAMSLGHTNVSIMPAGISGWVAAGKPVVSGDSPS